ncbi:uncharacterized protein LOC128557796 isoform X2 [Mercenaria mercenaria]|uniref:uncharacterized protein LOC128557796 isoform X2 n=1 Tax=Mercenaria mercenaria TaxID=6596 RepID=UPI00234E71AD|nr:uncharacterized protein LOC128557796 isoform X2 [Mercenaria mercenaria]
MSAAGASTSGAAEHIEMGEDARKCKEFLCTHIRLATRNPRVKVSSVRDIIQELVKGLPEIRHSLLYNKIKINGVKAPQVEIFKRHKVACQGYVDTTESQVRNKPAQHEKQILKKMEKFMKSEEFTDIDVRVGRKIFKCHKIVLAASSSYFKALFSSGMSEVQNGFVDLEAVGETEFRDILKVMYSGKCDLNANNVQGLLYTASYLQISFVEKDCIQFIENSIGEFCDSVHFELLKLSNDLSLVSITSRLIYWVACKLQHVRNLEVFKVNMTIDNIIELLDFPLNICSEDEICDSLLKWIEFDMEKRRQYGKDVISKINCLALTEKYMREVFLCHPVVRASTDLKEFTSKCSEYLARPGRQWEYIGEDEAALHRVGHKNVDVLAVCYPTSIQFTQFASLLGGHEYSGQFAMFRESRNDKLRNLKRRPDFIAACNRGRSQIVISTGTQLFYFNGDTCKWSCGPSHTAPSENNCLLYDPDLDCIYSVVAGLEKILIEKCAARCNDMEVLYAENARKEIVQNRTCAYLIGENIYLIKPYHSYTSENKCASIYRFNTITKCMTFIEDTELPFLCSTAVPYKDMVFLIDQSGENILRVSDNGTLIEQHGTVRGDFGYHIPALRISTDFGACIYSGQLILAGGRKTQLKQYFGYDLDSHGTCKYLNTESKCEPAVCLKMTICLERG